MNIIINRTKSWVTQTIIITSHHVHTSCVQSSQHPPDAHHHQTESHHNLSSHSSTLTHTIQSTIIMHQQSSTSISSSYIPPAYHQIRGEIRQKKTQSTTNNKKKTNSNITIRESQTLHTLCSHVHGHHHGLMHNCQSASNFPHSYQCCNIHIFILIITPHLTSHLIHLISCLQFTSSCTYILCVYVSTSTWLHGVYVWWASCAVYDMYQWCVMCGWLGGSDGRGVRERGEGWRVRWWVSGGMRVSEWMR